MNFFSKMLPTSIKDVFVPPTSIKQGAALLLGGAPTQLYQKDKEKTDAENDAAMAGQNQRSTEAATTGRVNPDGTYTPLVMDGGAHQASNAAATLTRAKYEDWTARFFPKVDELINMSTYMNPSLVESEINSAKGLTNQSFDNVTAGQNRNVARYGMTQTAEQQAAQDSALSLGRSAAVVGAENNTRLMLKDRDRAIATGGLGGTA